MDSLDSKICHGCFCNDRKITWLIDTERKQCFLQNVNENQILISEDDPVSLCWECDALLRRFAKFKSRVRQLYTTLRNCSAQHLQNQNSTNFKTNKLFNIHIVPNEASAIEEFEVIKSENGTDVKVELDEGNCENLECSENNCSDEDDQLLYLLCQKQKKEKVRLKKKRKRKQKTETKPGLNIYTEVDLTPEEIEEERRILSLKEDYVNALFRCIPCIISFPNVDDLRDHVSNKHDSDAPHECPICKCRFSSPISLHYHRTRHIRRLQCAACNLRFTGKRAFETHYDSEHCVKTDLQLEYSFKNKSLKNPNKETAEFDNGVIESDTMLNGDMFPCEFCDKTFRWKTSLRKHSEIHRIESGQARRPFCEPCRLSFTTTSNLQKHVKSSSKHQIQLKLRKMKETLTEDNTSPEKEQDRIDQIKSSINSVRQMYSCAQCDKRFQWRGNLIRHLHSHKARANGELVCEPCKRTFSSIATYKQHMKISRKHVSEQDFSYMCNDCGKKFPNKRRLKDHVDWEHLKNYTHKCNTCQKVFKSHTSLYLHKQVVHRKNNADHLCDHCGKPFPNRAKLRCHIKALHSTEAAYSCSICGARFSWHSCLSRHVRRLHKDKADKNVT